VLIGTRREWRRSSLPPQHRASAGGNAEQEGQEGDGKTLPRDPGLLGQRRRADLQRFGRLSCADVGILHIQSVGTSGLALGAERASAGLARSKLRSREPVREALESGRT